MLQPQLRPAQDLWRQALGCRQPVRCASLGRRSAQRIQLAQCLARRLTERLGRRHDLDSIASAAHRCIKVNAQAREYRRVQIEGAR